MSRKLQFNTLAMIYGVVALTALATWFLPGGEYQRALKDGRNLVVPGSFAYTAASPQYLWAMLLAPVKGFIQAAQIIVCLLVVGGSFNVLQKTGAVAAAIHRLAAAGFAGSVFNPFTVGIAQSICELPLYSGAGYRAFVWVLSTVFTIAFVMRHALRVEKDPASSPVYELDQSRRHSLHLDAARLEPIQPKHKRVLVVFALAVALLVFGVFRFKWYINEITGLFLGLGLAGGLAGALAVDEFTDAFKDGAKDMVGVCLIIACARATLVVAQDGKILDVTLHAMDGLLRRLHPIVCAQMMFVTQGIINFFVHSGSGQAALTMPIMAPLADVMGLSRQTAVLAFQFGEGWINPILPTSGVTMGVLGLAAIPYPKWFKWLLPMQLFFFVLALLLLIPPYFMHWQ